MKIAHKLIIGVMLLVSLIWVIGFYAVAVSRRALRESIERSSVELAVKMIGEVDRAIHAEIDDWRVYSSDLDVQRILEASNRRFEELPDIQAYINRQDRDWMATSKNELTPFIIGLMNNDLSEELKERLEAEDRHHNRMVYGEVFVTNRFGANVAQTSKTSDYRQDDEEWWQRAWKDGLYVEDVEYDKSAEVHSLNICMRVDATDGTPLGVIKAVLDIRWVIAQLQASVSESHHEEGKVEHGHNLVLLTADGKILFSSYSPTLTPKYGSTYVHQLPGPNASHTHTFQRYDDKHGQLLAACASSTGHDEYKGLGWRLVVEHNAEDVLAPITALRNNILIASMVIATGALLVGFACCVSLSRRIATLRDAAIALGRGNLEPRVQDNSSDEIGQLAQCFNEMGVKLKRFSDDLQKQAEVLERRVDERTKQLQASQLAALNMMADAEEARKKAEQANNALRQEVVDRKRAEEALQKRTHDLGERVKEINCLYGISKIIEDDDIAEEETIRKMLALIPPSWQYPDVTCARFIFGGKTFETDNFEETVWKQGSAIFVGERLAGALEVCYLQEMPQDHEGPFLKEERALIDGITDRLGTVLKRRESEAEVNVLNKKIEFILGATGTGLQIFDADLNVRYIDPARRKYYGDPAGQKCYRFFKDRDTECEDCNCPTKQAMVTGKPAVSEMVMPKENNRLVQITAIPFRDEKQQWLYASVNVDISERKRMEAELVQAQKLESIGHLAAGIAHEINTPSQYIGDNTRFLKEAFEDIDLLLGHFDRLLQAAKDGRPSDTLTAEVEAAVEEADLQYLTEEIPRALRQSQEGVNCVATIVKAMKEFSHPGGEQKQPIDLNRAIENTVTVSRNEWKYAADLTTDFDPTLPLVPCHPSEINQVILNVIVNAAQAIGEVVGESPQHKGAITIRSRRDGTLAEIRITDTGPGIPEEARPKVFDPFFTTKDVGKGTGQGLSIAYNIVVEKHGGTIDFETESGKGTTFTVRLPIADMPSPEQNARSEVVQLT